MLSRMEIVETNKMIKESNLDVRTITMGISLMDCADSDLTKFNQKIYDKITKKVFDGLLTSYSVGSCSLRSL